MTMPGQVTIGAGGDGHVAARDAVETYVRAMTRDDLVVHWQRRWRRPPPKGISRRLLEYNAAWLLQAEAKGGLAAATRRCLDALAGTGRSIRDGAAEGRRHLGKVDGTPLRRKLRTGSRLVRQWQGHSHVVEVIEGGFTFEGRPYTSLTAIAREITGARWSGPRFFGLNALAPDRKATMNGGEQRPDRKGGASATMDEGYHDD